MLRRETVETKLMDVLDVLMENKELKNLRLVGGTALALQLGHRNSVDIDLFGNHKHASDYLDLIISKILNVQSQKGSRDIRAYMTDGIKIDIVRYHYPWLDREVLIDGIRMASIRDIAAMKVAAITNRGSKKDFIDLYVLLDHFTLSEILVLYQQKISDSNEWLALKSISYFDDADQQPMPKLFIDISWQEIKDRIISAANDIGGFSTLPG